MNMKWSIILGTLFFTIAAFVALTSEAAAQPTVAFCLQKPLSGQITFSGLTFGNPRPPGIHANASGLPADEAIGIFWDEPAAFGRGAYLVANVRADPGGRAAATGIGFRQPEHPAQQITLEHFSAVTRQSVLVGIGVPCPAAIVPGPSELLSTGGADPRVAAAILAALGLASVGGGLLLTRAPSRQ